jgi:hypothetical protein
MAALVVLAAFFFADMILMAGWNGNRPLLHWMLAALGFAVYTVVFLLVSGVMRSSEGT